MSLHEPLPIVAPSVPTAKLGGSFPSVTVVNLRITCDKDTKAAEATLLGGAAGST